MLDLPPGARIPVKIAHAVIDRSSSTIYRWIADGVIATEDSPDGLTVTVGELQDAEAKMRVGRPPARRVAKVGRT